MIVAAKPDESSDTNVQPPKSAARLMKKVAEADDVKAFDQLRKDAAAYLDYRARHFLSDLNLAFDASEIVAAALARMLLERKSYSGDFVAWTDLAMKATVVENHRKVGRLLTREHKVFANADRESESTETPKRKRATTKVQDVADEGQLTPEILTVAWAALPEGHRRCLRWLDADGVRYGEICERITLVDNTLSPKIRRIRERLRELALYLSEREAHMDTLTRTPERSKQNGRRSVHTAVR